MNFKEKLKQRLTQELPAWEAQKLMSPAGVTEAYRHPKESHKKAAVVLLLFEEAGEVNCLFIKRADHPKDKHSGQISLPGGQLEGDETYRDAAIREVQEELGVSASSFEIIGAMSPIYVFVSDFMVQPYIAWLEMPDSFELQASEVAAIITTEITKFKDPQLRKVTEIHVRDRILKEVPYFDLDGRVLWGATAMMMSEFSSIIEDL